MGKTIVSVNTELPTVDNYIEYSSGVSLQDYDIIIFDPKLPYTERVNFTGGGSCIAINGAEQLRRSIAHWKTELLDALKAGKTVIFLLNELETDQAAYGSTSTKNNRTYQTSLISNYEVLPITLSVRNTKGQKIALKDPRFAGIINAVKDIVQYKVIIDSGLSNKIVMTKNGEGLIGGLANINGFSGNLILFPYFNLSQMYIYDEEEETEIWTKDALTISNKVVSQIIELDKALISGNNKTPAPEWLSNIPQPKEVEAFEKEIVEINNQLSKLKNNKEKIIDCKAELLNFSALLYETGKPLEAVIDNSLRLLGYKVENYRKGDVEIDHIITGPSGLRMIGESEGKDNSAINITKFRQLESNIGEDFEREEITTPAKGILFGNGYRLNGPDKRPDQFTDKCLTNAKRLGTALIQTTDLYKVVLHILDNTEDEAYKIACRDAIELTNGDVVTFPTINKGK